MKNNYLIIVLLVVAIILSSCSRIMKKSINDNTKESVTTERAIDFTLSITQGDNMNNIIITEETTDFALSMAQDDNGSPELECQSVFEKYDMMYYTGMNQKMYISDYLADNELLVAKYSVIDLDSDSLSETVLWLTKGTYEYYGFLILHENGDLVYAYELTYRAFYELKEDGTFSFSAGALDHGIGRIDFENDTCTINKIAYCESTYGAQKVSYYIDNADVSKEDFEEYITKHDQKQNVEWLEFAIDD